MTVFPQEPVLPTTFDIYIQISRVEEVIIEVKEEGLLKSRLDS